MSEVQRLDGILAHSMDDDTRSGIWRAVTSILRQGPRVGSYLSSNRLGPRLRAVR